MRAASLDDHATLSSEGLDLTPTIYKQAPCHARSRSFSDFNVCWGQDVAQSGLTSTASECRALRACKLLRGGEDAGAHDFRWTAIRNPGSRRHPRSLARRTSAHGTRDVFRYNNIIISERDLHTAARSNSQRWRAE